MRWATQTYNKKKENNTHAHIGTETIWNQSKVVAISRSKNSCNMVLYARRVFFINDEIYMVNRISGFSSFWQLDVRVYACGCVYVVVVVVVVGQDVSSQSNSTER